jgi:hypothetical protein
VLQIDLLIVKSCSVLDFFSSRFGGGSGESRSELLLMLLCGGMIAGSSGSDLAEFERERQYPLWRILFRCGFSVNGICEKGRNDGETV